jgi:hypothetical protein
MNTFSVKSLKLLALSALLVAGCDGMEKSASGKPVVVHAVATGGNVEEAAASEYGHPTILVDNAPLDAIFYVWFNVPLDGRTVQAAPNVSLSGATTDQGTNVAGSPLAHKDGIYLDGAIAYQPASADAGGLIAVSAPGLGSDPDTGLPIVLDSGHNWWVVGDYRVGGTVKDQTGIPGDFDVTFRVNHKPVFIPPDPYTIDVGWANDPNATGFTVQIQQVADLAAGPGVTWTDYATNVAWFPPVAQFEFASDLTTVTGSGNNETFRIIGLDPEGQYFVRVIPEGVTTAADSPENGIQLAKAPGTKAVANPILDGTTHAAGTVQLTWARIRSAVYTVEYAAPVTTGTPNWQPLPAGWVIKNAFNQTVLTNGFGPSSTNPYVVNVSGVPAGEYIFRVVPSWSGVPGTPTNASGTATVQ